MLLEARPASKSDIVKKCEYTNPHRSLVTQREFKGVETIGASKGLSG